MGILIFQEELSAYKNPDFISNKNLGGGQFTKLQRTVECYLKGQGVFTNPPNFGKKWKLKLIQTFPSAYILEYLNSFEVTLS